MLPHSVDRDAALLHSLDRDADMLHSLDRDATMHSTDRDAAMHSMDRDAAMLHTMDRDAAMLHALNSDANLPESGDFMFGSGEPFDHRVDQLVEIKPLRAGAAMRHHARVNNGPLRHDDEETQMVVGQEILKGPHNAEITITYKIPKKYLHRPHHVPNHVQPPPPTMAPRMPRPRYYTRPPPDIIIEDRPDPPLSTLGIVGGLMAVGAQFYLWGHVFSTCFKRPPLQPAVLEGNAGVTSAESTVADAERGETVERTAEERNVAT